MKRFSKVVTFLFIVFMLTGCIKYNAHMGISKQGEIELSVIVGLSNSLMEGEEVSGEFIDEENKAQYEQLGFKVEDYKDNDWTGTKLTKSYNITDVSTTSPVTVSLEDLLAEEQPLFQSLGNDTYKAHFVVDGTASKDMEGIDMDQTDAEQLEALYATMDMSYSVTLPGAPISHNAHKVDGNKLTWSIKYGEITTIEYEFSLKGTTSVEGNTSTNETVSNSNTNVSTPAKKDSTTMWIIVGVVVAAVLVVTVLVIVVSKKKKKNMNNVNVMNGVQPIAQMSVQPMAPNMQQPVQTNVVTPTVPVQQPVIPAAPETPVATPVVEQPQAVVSQANVASTPADTQANENQSANMQ